MQEFKLPDLGEGMHEAEVVEWLVKAGDTVKLDQTMVKVETDKAIVEIPSPVAGRIGEIRVQDGQVAKVGEVLVVFETSASSTGSSTRDDASSKKVVASSALKPSNVSTAPAAPEVSTSPKKRVLAAPAVRTCYTHYSRGSPAVDRAAQTYRRAHGACLAYYPTCDRLR